VLQHSFSPQLREILAPLQLGVGVKGATEQIGRKLQRILKERPESFVLQVDLSNAFNTVERTAIQEGLRSSIPELENWFEFTHSQPSPLFCNKEILLSTQGTQQGDPLGPAFFALAIHQVLESLQGAEGVNWEVWYLDDGVLVGDADALLQALKVLAEKFGTLGLKVNLSKCKLWSPQGLLVAESPIPTMEWETPKVVLGTPFGSKEAQRQFLGEIRGKHHFLLQQLGRFPDPQVAVQLLRHCLGAQKINHLLRVLWSEDVTMFAEETAHDIRLTLNTVLGSCLPDSAWLQSSLPIRHGGLGLQNPIITYPAAFVSSSLAECSGAFSPVGEQAEPGGEFWAAAQKLSHQIRDDILINWQLKGLPESKQLIEGRFHTQKMWTDKVNAQVKQDLFDSASLRDKVRLQSEGERHAGAWLNVVPNQNLGLRFGKGEFPLLLNFHLGVPLLPVAAAGSPCDLCGQPLDIYGDHFVSCRHSGAWKRHNHLRTALASISSSAGLSVLTEVQVNGKQRPADLLITNWDSGRGAAVDLTVVHSLNQSGLWDLKYPAVEKAEAAKVAKYQALCEAANLDFIPLGLETFGSIGTHGRCFLEKLFGKYAKRFATEGEQRFPGQLQKECWERVAVALQKAVAEQLCSVFTVLGCSEPMRGAPGSDTVRTVVPQGGESGFNARM
jgi:hypothetical protein